jgi:hypothetical protein
MLPTFTMQMYCPKCGYVRPEGFNAKQCSQCGAAYVAKPIINKPLSPVACEKANVCPDVSDSCLTAPEDTSGWRVIPKRRWMDCYSYKQMLKLKFLVSLGVYHLPQCPLCGLDLEETLKRNFEEVKKCRR